MHIKENIERKTDTKEERYNKNIYKIPVYLNKFVSVNWEIQLAYIIYDMEILIFFFKKIRYFLINLKISLSFQIKTKSSNWFEVVKWNLQLPVNIISCY